ncbi:pyridine nucleotide-disulfide oxidoreductase [Marispirochaeta aestuarii]|uniref:Pyridine nucleotide-disulfide oxidoreductase n=1 Tax=Marispirochaeta aestuarii TaxID=1963862 RepID=A0A1Y1RVJ0_9SPIO|nr:FAD-dependent oxidoreductase [Marispirochaeta aestuarii]ORC34049.1 pyridine nucleotide-disulfide oxidoreductase [Marispirochaeta aestuarii]
MAKKILVIGGSASGPKAAARARRLDFDAEIIILQKAHDLSMASCGYPYYVGGFFDDRNQLLCTPTGVVRDPVYYMKAKNIIARTDTEVTGIDRKAKKVTAKNLLSGETETYEYDKLILAMGATPRMPPVPGIDLDGITTLQSMPDADYLRKVRDEGKIRKAVVVGGGLIGIETCEALQLAGIKITVVEMLPQILMFLDWQLAKILENHVKAHAADVITDNAVSAFLGDEKGKLRAVKLANGDEIPCEMAVVAIGVVPNTKIAKDAGIETGRTGGITVNEYMQTNDPDIYAVGDCTEIPQRLTGSNVHAPYGDLANLEGRVAGENAARGNIVTFPGTIQTGVCKVFDFSAGSTGISKAQAEKLGYRNVVSVTTSGPDKPGFMGAKILINRMIADGDSGKILGFQCIGMADASKQIGMAAMAIMGGLTVDQLVNADLPYAPPFSLAIDNIVACAHALQNKIRGLMEGCSAVEVKAKLDKGEKPFIIDTRSPEEWEEMRLGVGEHLIPVGALRHRLNELPEDKNTEIITYCKISLRGYEAARTLIANGYTNVKVMEGGLMAWPYHREK